MNRRPLQNRRPHSGRRPARCRDQRGGGSDSIEALILFPVLILLIGVMVIAGVVAVSHDAVDAAASSAARAASLERTPEAAISAAQRVAAENLRVSSAPCRDARVTVDTSGFAVPLGQEATIAVTVHCQVAVNALVPGGGGRTITGAARSPLDLYRQRGR